MSDTPQNESHNDAPDNRTFEDRMAENRSHEEKMEVYLADYEENPDYWESDEDYVGPS